MPIQEKLRAKRFLHPDEVRKILGYANRASFWTAVKRGGIPYIRVNQRRFLFDEEEVSAWLDRHRVGGKK